MNKEFIAICEISFYSIPDEDYINENIVLTEVNTYAEAMTRIEAYYGNDLESARITLLDGPFLRISNRIIDEIMTKEIENE